MIPPRTLNGDGFGNGVRYRVSACRKRLRHRRSTHRTQAHILQDEQSRETESCSIPGQDTPTAVLAASGVPKEAEST
jgi:hypothetical protein